MVSSSTDPTRAGYGASSCMYSSPASGNGSGYPFSPDCQYYANLHGAPISMTEPTTLIGGSTVTTGGAKSSTGKQGVKRTSSYKHIPHREKPPHLVQRRNARERRRVQAVNTAFSRLRRHIPHENRNKRLSKVKTLKIAMDYIEHLRHMITTYDSKMMTLQTQPPHPSHDSNKHVTSNGAIGDKWHHPQTYVEISPQNSGRDAAYYPGMFGPM
uniref:Achaete-scute C transcription factor n=1 Tax=Malacoceros fuliginosus TaxID=271776 RepID=A0A7G9UKX7_MALFL|nr:achaete-scute C transcription factor [Malacoceros fuliginosus]